jgi:pimeloyl-ACP methyl ester carboxylesterase
MQNANALSASPARCIAGIEVEVWTKGSGRPVLFLHPGDGLDPHADCVERLARRHSVLAPSHPGFGASQLPEHFTSVDDLAYFYLDLMKAHDLEDAVVIGVSFGAWVAAAIAIKSVERIAGLVLVDSIGAKFADRTTREIGDLFSVNIHEQATLIYHDPIRRKPSFAEVPQDALTRLARGHETFALFAWSPTLHDPKLAHRLHRIAVPTLVVWGREDRVVSVDYGRQFAARIPGSRLEIIDDAGHYPHLEHPERFDEIVGRFIETLPATSTSRNAVVGA